MTTDARFILEFNDWTPDAIEQRPVKDLDWRNEAFPEQTYLFVYFDRDDPRRTVSDWFYLTTDPRILSAEEARQEYPAYADDVTAWAEKGVSSFANHAYSHGQNHGGRVIPLLPNSALIDKATMRQVWPANP